MKIEQEAATVFLKPLAVSENGEHRVLHERYE